ncbi:hypothetical protein BV25DRAFT_1831774 [Artomyces pyxidatus]|uniref:Uncharacterized protein n=1 Tax=Artomyces pyxidatus TaxID=48021 RepID=A0ACB8SK03_9AGAM|nr:hypothetical protein BV25DRAFT_1831774 [Artomyces pyxidatus]
MASFFRAYNALLLRRPLAAQCGTSMLIFGAGDVLAQQAVERRGKKHDIARTARLAFYGGALFAPPITKWLQFLGRLQFSSPTKAIIYRTWLDQSLAAPLVVGWFFTSMTFLEGHGLSEATERMKASYAPTLMRGWLVFGPAQAINFWLVPPQLRFVFLGVVSLFWNTYLSAVNAKHDLSELTVY